MTALRKDSVSLVEGEFHFTLEDFKRLAAIMHADAGIALPESKATLVYSRLAKRLRTLGLESFRDYCALVAGSEGADERVQMLAALTTNVTRFFREPHHFEHMKQHVLPPLMEVARRGGRVRLWSAACSSGQEPYSMAMTVLSLMPEAGQYDLKILATDIDPNMVAAGRAGLYRQEHLDGVSQEQLRKFFIPVGPDKYQASEALQDLVAFRELNLIGPWPMKGDFQVIMCRNVVIYFDEETQARVWPRFAACLEGNGRLYIGHSERLNGPAVDLFEPEAITTYRRNARRP